jgi:hypothetical protein
MVMERYQLRSFSCSRNPTTGDLLLLVSGPTSYKAILARAFPSLWFSSAFPDRFGHFDWGTYIKQAGPSEETALGALCRLFGDVVCMADDLDESFALAFHTQTSPAGGYTRTAIGQLVREAKPYDRTSNPGNSQRATELAGLLSRFIQQHPTYQRAEVLLAVPPSNTEKAFDLPSLLVAEVARQTGQYAATASLRKVRGTRPMKDCQTVQEKVDNLKDAFGRPRCFPR